ncbi:nucleotidyltransferase (macronuclear) [Tetrahymena thermophila SB210]|uniref:Nucleotidyltransferase n=1 Tax=Tetrahymena thermophila (strain SB210) TaxID=312017 RepID=I7MCR4_TETTS|nr:nucleotidyltransferase [Tetrahymena thermophila SB210]EAR84682.2 nucleotidyltransferase [Tetrahymena thermophila SB210]|eukprot:XP_001032345.2 nucleotidyltransferase [Tetrahymena thermophila SB210]
MTEIQLQIAKSQENPELDVIIKDWAIKFIKDLEIKHNMKVLFAAETGSRGYGTHMKDSDFDIKGFFIYPAKTYMSVMGGPSAIREDHFRVEVNGKEYELDFEFYDIKKFLKKKVIGNLLDHMNFRFYSQKQYINMFDNDIFLEIRDNLKLPIEKFYAVTKGFYTAFTKDIKSKRQIVAKDILNSIVIGFQFLHCAYFYEYPLYNFHQEQQLFLSRIKQTDNDQYEYYSKVIQTAYEYYQMKISDRKFKVQDVNPIVIEFLQKIIKMNPLENDQKIIEIVKRKEITEERANQIFESLIEITKN